MTTPGFFEIYSSARPALPAGNYKAGSASTMSAVPPHGANGTIPVDGTDFRVHIDAPRYVMPPDQILSTFPPAGAQGDWRERLPQIVLKRRTLPWERNPLPNQSPQTAPPWLALVVLAEGEGLLSPDVDVSQCVSTDVDLGSDADVAKGKYLEVTKDVIDKVFPCQDELDLLCHVRKVDLRDTELALGDDDGYLAVVLSNRLPQPGPPASPGTDPLPRKHTAYLINLEEQIPSLLATEPNPAFDFDSNVVFADERYLAVAPNASLDQIAMQIGAGTQFAGINKGPGSASLNTELVAYGAGRGLETAASSWASGPVGVGAFASSDVGVASAYKDGLSQGYFGLARERFRFPVLASWEFTCTGSGGFERLMNSLDVGLLGTLDSERPPPQPEVALTGHVALDHRTRHGDPARSWYRGPLSPQPTSRTEATDGVLPLAHTGDQLRRVVPDGREDISQAAMFEIGRLMTLSKPTLVAALMSWRRDLFGAARARELADLLAGVLLDGVGIIGGLSSLESLIRTRVVGAFTDAEPGRLAPFAQEVTAARRPRELEDLGVEAVLRGLGLDPAKTFEATKMFGPEGLGAAPVGVAEATSKPVSGDRLAISRLNNQLSGRVEQLTVDALKLEFSVPHGVGVQGQRRRGRGKDDLDRLIEASAKAAEVHERAGE